MAMLILGDGPFGQAVAAAAAAAGEATTILGRPAARPHPPTAFVGADVVVEASRGEAVASNVDAALAGGVRRFVIATSAWDADRARVEAALRAAGAAAVIGASFSLGMALFGRLVERAAALYGPVADFDPFVVEWHRRSKADRPSGTARALTERLRGAGVRIDPAEVVSIRAGSSPGMHLVGWDAVGETVELRLTARDRSAYTTGILAAADWLRRAPRPAGPHPFDVVVDELLARPAAAA